MEIRIQCAWCQKMMGTKKGQNEDHSVPLVTHSICPSCYQRLSRELTMNDYQFIDLRQAKSF